VLRIGNLIIRSSFSNLFIKRFSIPTWMPCIVLAVYSISVLRFQQYLRRLFLVSGQYIPLILFLDFSYVLILRTQVSNLINHEHRRNCKQIGEHTTQYGLFIFTFKTSKYRCCLHFMFPLHFRFVINLLFYVLQDFHYFSCFKIAAYYFSCFRIGTPHYPPHKWKDNGTFWSLDCN
jgi:hypothetical protein